MQSYTKGKRKSTFNLADHLIKKIKNDMPEPYFLISAEAILITFFPLRPVKIESY